MNGVILTKVHRVISFRQKAWIEPYISENTKLRQDAQDAFEKDYYKLLNNAFFGKLWMILIHIVYRFLVFPLFSGKTMENLRNRIKVVLVNNTKSANWQHSKPTYKRFSIFDENLVGVELTQTNIVLDKPLYVSICYV